VDAIAAGTLGAAQSLVGHFNQILLVDPVSRERAGRAYTT
jgi:hypothetical protein